MKQDKFDSLSDDVWEATPRFLKLFINFIAMPSWLIFFSSFMITSIPDFVILICAINMGIAGFLQAAFFLNKI